MMVGCMENGKNQIEQKLITVLLTISSIVVFQKSIRDPVLHPQLKVHDSKQELGSE